MSEEANETQYNRVIDLSPRIDRAEVLRCLGYRESKSPLERVEATLDGLWDAAQAKLAPRAVMCLVCLEQAQQIGVPQPTERVFVGVVTIGQALEDEISRLQSSGRLLDALILDAIGSAAAEATAEELEGMIRQQAKSMGLHPRPRISPGYGSWDVRCQRELLALLPIGELGLRLTSGMMMIPRKSVSFVVRLEQSSHRKSKDPARCESCDKPDCRYRTKEPVPSNRE